MKKIKRIWFLFKKNKRILSGVVVFVVLLILLTVFYFTGVFTFSNSRELESTPAYVPAMPTNPISEEKPTSVLPVSPTTEESPNISVSPTPSIGLNHSSFSDTFSGTGWINEGATTMYQDKSATAFMFPPKFDWARADNANQNNFVERKEDGGDTRCLGNKCLIQRGLNIFFKDGEGAPEAKIILPAELKTGLVNVSIGNLDDVWLVGGVIKDGSNFRGNVFYFDGNKFADLGVNISSQYEGVIGFGGSNSDWLITYGAYEGVSFRVQDGEFTDISNFLERRIMDGGFQPAVLKTGLGDNTRFYIFSLTEGKPKLVKLFQNGESNIQGVVDLSPLLFTAQTKTASFYINPSNSDILFAKVATGLSQNEFWKFTDKGFNKSKKLEIVSANINNYPAEVRTARISEIDFSNFGAKPTFYLSNDGDDWEKVAIGEDVVFDNKSGRELRWRAIFYPKRGAEMTPFLDRIRLDFQVKFL